MPPSPARVDAAYSCHRAPTQAQSGQIRAQQARCHRKRELQRVALADHAGNGNANEVSISIEFPAEATRGAIGSIGDPVKYAVFVFDPAQGSDAAAQFQFDTTPSITPFESSSSTSLSELAAWRYCQAPWLDRPGSCSRERAARAALPDHGAEDAVPPF